MSKNGIIIEYTDILGKKAKTQLKALDVRSCYRSGIDGYVRLTETLRRVAVAREMLKIICSMLTNNRPFVKV